MVKLRGIVIDLVDRFDTSENDTRYVSEEV
jgi:hypothetical protein